MSQINPQQVIETQRQDWNRVAPAWEKWDSLIDRNMAFINYRLVGDARIRAGQRVLDLGCGTGYPALLAAIAVGEKGSVLGLDLAEDMLSAARRKAKSLGLSHVEFRAGDVTALPFDPASYDAVISRFCLMFLPDIPKAVAEIARVLKPGGYLAAAVWAAPEKNPFFSLTMGVLKSYLTLPPPDPEQPGVFRLARPGDLAGMVERAGLKDIRDEEFTGESVYVSEDEYLKSLLDMAAPLQPLFGKLTPEQRPEVEAKIKKAAGQYRHGGTIAVPMTIRLVVARKPY
jgi:ubiquinone/menaquinone biosynthesis C-methylase UbiE